MRRIPSHDFPRRFLLTLCFAIHGSLACHAQTSADLTVHGITPMGTLPAATAVVTDDNGNASVEFNLGTAKEAILIRAEETSQ